MNDQNTETTKQNEEKEKKFLQSDDKEVIEKRNPPEDSDAISNAGKKRSDEKRYQ